MFGMSSVVTAVIGLLVLLVLVGLLVASRYKVAGPNEAYIVTGRRGREVKNPETGVVSTDLSGQKVVMGGGVFVVPFVQRLGMLDLSSRRIPVQIRGAVSGQGIKLNLDGVALVKVGGNEDSIRAAAQRFMSQQEEVETFTQETLAGALRSIVGSLSVEQIIRDRAAFAQRVADESEASLTGQGLVLDTFQIQDITDDGSYLTDLGRPEAAKVQRMAAVAEAAARQEAEQARLAAEQQVAIANRELALKVAEIKAETDAAAAKAQSIAQAEGEAEKARLMGVGDKSRRTALAEAEAIEGAKKGEAEKARRIAEADAVRAEGEARAAAILATGQAEAEAMDKKADAFARYGEAAVLQMLVEVLPQVAKEVAAPMAAIEKLTVISTDGAGAMPKQVTNNVVQTMELIKNATGVDLTKMLSKYGEQATQPSKPHAVEPLADTDE